MVILGGKLPQMMIKLLTSLSTKAKMPFGKKSHRQASDLVLK